MSVTYYDTGDRNSKDKMVFSLARRFGLLFVALVACYILAYKYGKSFRSYVHIGVENKPFV